MFAENKSISLIRNYWLFCLTLFVTFFIWFSGINHALFFAINEKYYLFPVSLWEIINYVTKPTTGILPGLLLIITFVFRRDKIFNVIILLIVYFLFFYILKTGAHEARPFVQYDPSTFYWLSDFPEGAPIPRMYNSFPSGHTGNTAIFAFSLSYLFAQNKRWLQILLLLFIVLTMLARICTGWHFPLDVLAAALIGYLLVQICMNFQIRKKH